MLATIQRTLERWQLARDVRKAVVAVSGGADSIALLEALHALWSPSLIRLVVAHIHHGIRNVEADADACFVAESARRLGLPFAMRRVDVPATAASTGESHEMAARRLRRNALLEVAAEESADAICTGHTADDQIETLFLRLARGTGPRGLGGIAPRTRTEPGPPWLRPLLDCRRADLRAWLTQAGATWREDSTNHDLSIPRNRVRARLVPALAETFGPPATANLLRTLDLLRDEEDGWLQPLVDREFDTLQTEPDAAVTEVECARLRAKPPALVRRLLLAWLQQQGIPAEHQTFERLEALTALALAPDQGSRQLDLGGGWTAHRVYGALHLSQGTAGSEEVRPVRLAVPGTTTLADGLEVVVERTQGYRRSSRTTPWDLPLQASLRADGVAACEWVWRSVRKGDHMRPLGCSGHRKLSDILIDWKIPKARRPRVPVLVCGETVAWLPGYAVAAPFAVPDDQAPAYRVTLRNRPAPSGGFTLVEVLVALVLTTLVLVPATLALHHLLRSEQELNLALRAELAARQELGEAVLDRSSEPADAGATRTRFTPDGTLRTTLRSRRDGPESPTCLTVEAADANALSTTIRSVVRELPPPRAKEPATP